MTSRNATVSNELAVLEWAERECKREPKHAAAALEVLITEEKRRIAEAKPAKKPLWKCLLPYAIHIILAITLL